MSAYMRNKVLRVPLDKYGMDNEDTIERFVLEEDYTKYDHKFKISTTARSFLDYVLESEYGVSPAVYGKTRALYQSEQEKYKPIFQQKIPSIDMNDVRLVEYCWHNSTEAPDYYDEVNDDFYKEV